LNRGKRGKIWKKCKLNREKIWKIWKLNKLNSEKKRENMEERQVE
jgi:hypothetical protein